MAMCHLRLQYLTLSSLCPCSLTMNCPASIFRLTAVASHRLMLRPVTADVGVALEITRPAMLLSRRSSLGVCVTRDHFNDQTASPRHSLALQLIRLDTASNAGLHFSAEVSRRSEPWELGGFDYAGGAAAEGAKRAPMKLYRSSRAHALLALGQRANSSTYLASSYAQGTEEGPWLQISLPDGNRSHTHLVVRDAVDDDLAQAGLEKPREQELGSVYEVQLRDVCSMIGRCVANHIVKDFERVTLDLPETSAF